MASIAVLAVLWLVVLWRVRTLWQAGWKRAPWVALAALAVALTLNLSAVITAVDTSSGVPELATLVKHLAGIIASEAVLEWVAALANPGRAPRVRAYRAGAAAAVASMSVLFALMPRAESDDFNLTETSGLATAYLLVFYACLGTAMAVATVLFWRASRLSPRGTVRWGFWLLAAGTSLGACEAVYQVAFLILRSTVTFSTAEAKDLIFDGADIQNGAIAFILAGMCVPAFGVAWQNGRDLAALRALRPMWRDLVAAVPGATAGSWLPVVAGSAGAPRTLLISRVGEIRDAALALRAYVSPDQVADARARLAGYGLSGVSLDAAVEACWLKLASAARLSDAPRDQPHHKLPGGDTDTLLEEVRWLRLVAAASGSEPVKAVTAQVAGGSLAHPEGTPQ